MSLSFLFSRRKGLVMVTALQTVVVSVESLLAILLDVKGCPFASIVVETEPRMRKTDNPHMGTVKRSSMAIQLGIVYENSVNNQRDRENVEERVEVQERRWGQRIPKTTMVEHNGSFYLEAKIVNVKETAYFNNGVEIDAEELKPFLYVRKQSKTQGDEKPVVLRDFKMSSIRELKLNGNHYMVE